MEIGKTREKRGIEAQRDYSIYKKNDVIQKSRYSLTLNQQKTLLYLISKVQVTDSIDKVYTLPIKEYCNVAGIKDATNRYMDVKADIRAIADASVWIMQPDGKEALVRWLDIVRLDQGSGTIEISFTKSIEPYLFFFTDDGFYTSYPLLYILPMGCKYSIRLYELLKSYANTEELTLTVDDLKVRLDAADDSKEDYKRFVDFRKFVIDRAIAEINQYTDIKAEYAQIREGRKTVAIRFFITKKKPAEKMIATRAAKQIFSK